uniref:SAM domain-containing protein n=1 Tax=Palpitomonas bilix TaxID=652834 RepID=A0A7S3CZ86_9EUKA|mmetsp:Transcript_15325/g.38716  ORF Transcript_15325/g.38716 Transcript_15325/m.38716 type:complete len:700 (+) Transcript_15325:102-2201(+)
MRACMAARLTLAVLFLLAVAVCGESGGGADGEINMERWVHSLGLRDPSSIVRIFEDNEVDGSILHTLTEKDMHEMGITSIGAVRKITSAAQLLKKAREEREKEKRRETKKREKEETAVEEKEGGTSKRWAENSVKAVRKRGAPHLRWSQTKRWLRIIAEIPLCRAEVVALGKTSIALKAKGGKPEGLYEMELPLFDEVDDDASYWQGEESRRGIIMVVRKKEEREWRTLIDESKKGKYKGSFEYDPDLSWSKDVENSQEIHTFQFGGTVFALPSSVQSEHDGALDELKTKEMANVAVWDPEVFLRFRPDVPKVMVFVDKMTLRMQSLIRDVQEWYGNRLPFGVAMPQHKVTVRRFNVLEWPKMVFVHGLPQPKSMGIDEETGEYKHVFNHVNEYRGEWNFEDIVEFLDPLAPDTLPKRDFDGYEPADIPHLMGVEDYRERCMPARGVCAILIVESERKHKRHINAMRTAVGAMELPDGRYKFFWMAASDFPSLTKSIKPSQLPHLLLLNPRNHLYISFDASTFSLPVDDSSGETLLLPPTSSASKKEKGKGKKKKDKKDNGGEAAVEGMSRKDVVQATADLSRPDQIEWFLFEALRPNDAARRSLWEDFTPPPPPRTDKILDDNFEKAKKKQALKSGQVLRRKKRQIEGDWWKDGDELEPPPGSEEEEKQREDELPDDLFDAMRASGRGRRGATENFEL